MYDTNGLTLDDLYPYGEEHGDTARTANDLPKAKLLQPIDNLIGLGLNGLTATSYQVSYIFVHTSYGMQLVIYMHDSDMSFNAVSTIDLPIWESLCP